MEEDGATTTAEERKVAPSARREEMEEGEDGGGAWRSSGSVKVGVSDCWGAGDTKRCGEGFTHWG